MPVLLATYDFGLEVACAETSKFINYNIIPHADAESFKNMIT